MRWQTNGLLPVSFIMDHLQTKFFKDNLQAMTEMQEARKLYDLEYPCANGKGPHITNQQIGRNARSTGLTVQTQPETNVNDEIEDGNLQTLASLCMIPEISPMANPIDTATATLLMWNLREMTQVIMAPAMHISHWTTLIYHVTIIMIEPIWRKMETMKTFWEVLHTIMVT